MERTGQARRSVTVRPELNTRLREFVAACLRAGIDLDYTKALNLFAELGEKWLESSNHSEREKLQNVWAAYVDYQKLEASEALNDWREYDEFRQWKLAKARRIASKARDLERVAKHA
jgi:hypothetical protein